MSCSPSAPRIFTSSGPLLTRDARDRPVIAPRPGGDVVVVTGSSGWFGLAVVGRLAGYFTVVGFHSETPPHLPAAAEFTCVDFTSEASCRHGTLANRLRGSHRVGNKLAACFDLSGKDDPTYEAVTVRGSERLLDGFVIRQSFPTPRRAMRRLPSAGERGNLRPAPTARPMHRQRMPLGKGNRSRT